MNGFDIWGPPQQTHYNGLPAPGTYSADQQMEPRPYHQFHHQTRGGYPQPPGAPLASYRGAAWDSVPPPPMYTSAPKQVMTFYSSSVGGYVTEFTTVPWGGTITTAAPSQASTWSSEWWKLAPPAYAFAAQQQHQQSQAQQMIPPPYVHNYAPPKVQQRRSLPPPDDDHPSFARPPHRPIERKAKPTQGASAPAASIVPVVTASGPEAVRATVDPAAGEELVPNSYPVPPPPPYAQSAAPLSDLAAEMVWDRCFGAADAGRKKYLTRRDFGGEVSAVGEARLGGEGVTSVQPQQPAAAARSIGSASPGFGAIGGEAKTRRASQAAAAAAAAASAVRKGGAAGEVKPAFRRWCKQVLEQTLLSPQVLMLALMYVNTVVIDGARDVFAENGDTAKATQMTPYKVFLAGLVLANKTLDDHSYKNSTFSNVSSMTNQEVNDIEVRLLVSLGFNTVPQSDEWKSWLNEVVAFGDRIGCRVNTSGSGRKIEACLTPLAACAAEEKKKLNEEVLVPETWSPPPTTKVSGGGANGVAYGVTRSPKAANSRVPSSSCGGVAEPWAGRTFGNELVNRPQMVAF